MFRPPEYAALIMPIQSNVFFFCAYNAGSEGSEEKRCCLFCELLEIGPREWSPRTGKCLCRKHPKKS